MPHYSANVTMLWPEIDDPYRRFAAAAAAGFARVERLFMHDLDADRVEEQLTEWGLELVLFDPYPGDWEAGDRGLSAVPGRESECRQSVLEAIETASRLGVGRINVLSGMLADDISIEHAKETAAANLSAVAPAAAAAGITLLMEPINAVDWPGYAIPTVSDAMDVIAAVGDEAVRLQFDAYHVARAGEDIRQRLAATVEFVRHIQIADAPGRHQPGTGSLQLGGFLEDLDQLGYGGSVGLEYIPLGSTTEALSWLPRSARG